MIDVSVGRMLVRWIKCLGDVFKESTPGWPYHLERLCPVNSALVAGFRGTARKSARS
jgi:hypothetical protein